MTSNERSFPWDDHNGDREYSSDEFAEFFSTLFKPGIVATANFGSGLQITESASLGMRVKFGAGEAFSSFGRNYVHDKDEEVTVPIASTLQDRTDSVAIQFNKSQREAFFVYKESDTTVTRTDSIFELQIAKILVPKNSTQITNANITDTRADTKVCGYSSPYESIKTGDLLAQFKSELEANGVVFSDWFENIKGQLSEDAAGHLQNQLDSLDSKVYTAYANSADGTNGFTTVYPNLNLLDGTKDFSGTWSNSDSWTTDGTYKGLTVKKRTGQWNGIYKTFTAPKDGTYTFSAYIKSSGNTANIIRFGGVNTTSSQEALQKSMGNNFDRTIDSITLNLKANDSAWFKYEISGLGADSILWTAGHKWEPGSTATPHMASASEVQPSDYPQYKYLGRMTGLNVADKNDPKNYKWQINTDVVRDESWNIVERTITTRFTWAYGLVGTLRRTGNTVEWIIDRNAVNGSTAHEQTADAVMPLGFRPIERAYVDVDLTNASGFMPWARARVDNNGNTYVTNNSHTGVRTAQAFGTWITNDPWPEA